ncbi:MAG: cytochrome c [Sulfurovaceae bacterium]|nr:cytochrome c [Sulfurovaceae bacterium]
MKIIIISIIVLAGTQLVADVKAGEKVYRENCAICHTINGGGGMGPDLNMVSYSRHTAEIEYYAKEPYNLFKTFGYSANAMPTLPLEDKQFKDVAEYISSLVKFKKWMIKKKPEKNEKSLIKSSENNETVKSESRG